MDEPNDFPSPGVPSSAGARGDGSGDTRRQMDNGTQEVEHSFQPGVLAGHPSGSFSHTVFKNEVNPERPDTFIFLLLLLSLTLARL